MPGGEAVPFGKSIAQQLKSEANRKRVLRCVVVGLIQPPRRVVAVHDLRRRRPDAMRPATGAANNHFRVRNVEVPKSSI